MASTYKTTEGRRRSKNTYHVSCEARRASRLAPIGFDDVPPAGYAIPEPKARTKSRRTRKAGTRKSTYMKAKPRKRREAKRSRRARYEAQTWRGPKGQERHFVVDMGANALITTHTSREAADKGADALNREYRKAVSLARKAVA